jgi:hypothetical protein
MAREDPMKPPLTIEILYAEAKKFAGIESCYPEPSIYGVTDGKAIGTYLEHKFKAYLQELYGFTPGNSASGIDFPELNVDMKVTSIRQPQSSCPFKSARQKIYGLGYSLLVFVYEKVDDPKTSSGMLNLLHTIFVHKEQTADFQTSSGILKILENQGNIDDLIAFMIERNLPIDETEACKLAEELLQNPPELGFLTISNALQWRLQYSRIIDKAGEVEGLLRLR